MYRQEMPVRRRMLVFTLSITVVALVGGCGYWYYRYQQIARQQSRDSASQAGALAARLKDIIDLPDEQPGLATVLDRTKLGNPQLVSRAQNNDQLLVYTKAKRVILYRPATGKVIDMFHVVSEDKTLTPATTPRPMH